MRIVEKYRVFQQIQAKINEKLENNTFEDVKELQLWLAKSSDYQRLKNEENSLIMLERFCKIWIEEKKNILISSNGEDIFEKINNLDQLGEKYLDIKYLVLKIENGVPIEYVQAGIEKIVNWNVSGLAVGTIINQESKDREKNALKCAELLMCHGELIRAIELLQYSQENISSIEDFFLQEADCWIQGKQWETALQCLKKIEQPNREIIELIKDLEQVV